MQELMRAVPSAWTAQGTSSGFRIRNWPKIVRYKARCIVPGFSDTRRCYAASWVVILEAIQCRRASAGLR